MLAQPAILLGSVPLYSPFPMMLVLSAVATVAFGARLVIARVRVHPRTWLYVLLGICVALGAAFMAWSGYSALYGPYEVSNPRAFWPHVPDASYAAWYDLYRSVLFVNVAIVLVTPTLVLVFGIVLWRQKRS